MSWRLRDAVEAAYDGPRAALRVLTVLCDFANAHGLAWPSVATIAERSRLTERRVRCHLATLEKGGWIVAVGSRKGGRSMTVRWHVIAAKAPINPDGFDRVSPLNEAPETEAPNDHARQIRTPETLTVSTGNPDGFDRKPCRFRPETLTVSSAEAVKNRSGTDQEQINPHVRAREQQPLDCEQTTATPVCKENPNGCTPTVAPNAVPLLPTTNIPAADQPEALAALARSWNVVSFPGQSAGELRARLIRRQAEVAR